MSISVSKLIYQTKIILMEHGQCDRRCLGERQLDPEQHDNHVASIISYYALGEDK